LLFLDYGIRRWREPKQPGNEEQTAHLQTGLLHGLCDLRCEPLGGTFAEWDYAEAFPCLLSSFSTNGLTCLLHLHFTMCSIAGAVEGLRGRADAQPADPVCWIDFKVDKGRIGVSSKTYDACREFCGMRAWFEGDYLLPPAGCTGKEREARKKPFLTYYKSHDYANALDAVNGLYTQCKDFLNWIEIDAVRNDIAVTQLHLGQRAACQDILKDALGVRYPNKEALQENLPPTDFDSYLPVAKATWFNLRQCSGPK